MQNYLAAEQADPTEQVGDDTYWTGKGLGRAARLAEISDDSATAVRDAALNAIRPSSPTGSRPRPARRRTCSTTTRTGAR